MEREELRRRVVDGVEAEIALFAGCSERSSIVRMPGVLASVSPATPDRSIFNSVVASGPEPLVAALDELATIYRDAGVHAWTVWVPDFDRASGALLADRGHALDGAPRGMALELDELRPVPLPDGVEVAGGEMATIGSINDRAYGIDGPGWAAAMPNEPTIDVDSGLALVDGEPVACALVIASGDDACVSAVATLPEHRGRGLAGALISRLLTAAGERGVRTGSLQASKAGAPVYERLGFADLGFIELWERREA
ncbi:MAG TPA: GNAT family N-acetyltransferase [Solirubrobacterales bacterium]|nr:GNAT family N-acetyltransferase [Solirubrobacterales bacterium]